MLSRVVPVTGRSEELFERAARVIPGGVNSPVRAFGAVGGSPRFVARTSSASFASASFLLPWNVTHACFRRFVPSGFVT